MHKKVIHGKEYYYSSYREDGKVKSKYLGSDKKLAIKKEREMNGESSNLLTFLFVGLMLILSGFSFFMGVTSYTSYDVISFDWDERYVNSTFVRVSLNSEVYDVPVSNYGSSITIDLSEFEFNSSGAGYVDLIWNETVVESVIFLYSLNESLSAQNQTLGDAELNNSVDLGLNESLSVQNPTLDDVVSNETIDSGFNITVNEGLDVIEDVPLVNLTANGTVSVNESLEDVNITFGVPVVNLTTNETVVSNYSLGTVDVSEEVVQYGAVIGEQVKWKKKIVLSAEVRNLSVEIPESAENVSVVEIIDNVEFVLDGIKVNDSGVVKDIEDTEYVVNEVSGFFGFITGFFSSITGMFVAEEQGNVSLIIEEEVEEVEVEYYTEAPSAIEEETVYGKKVVVSSETHYENILTYTFIPDTSLESIELYWIVNGSRVAHEFDGYDTNDNGLVDYLEWVTPHTSEQEFEIELTILNVQSYPIVGGSWTVMFNTTGTADLMVVAINETTFGEALPDDLEFIEIRCGSEVVNSSYNGTVFVENYSCAETGYEESFVLTSGVHDLEFRFGDLVAYAHNDASNAPTQGTPKLNATTSSNTTADNLTVYNVSTADLDGDPVKNVINWYKDGTSLAVLNMPMEGDTNSSNVKDYSAWSYNGTRYNAIWNGTSGYDGFGAYEFDGSGDYISLGDKIDIGTTTDLTVSLWIKTQKNTEELVAKTAGSTPLYRLQVTTNGRILARVNDGSNNIFSIGTTNVTDNNWYHVVWTLDRDGDQVIYVNGIEEDRDSIATVEDLDTSGILAIGRFGSSATSYFNGSIDEVLIFNRSLSVEQIRAIYMNQTDVIVSQETNVGDVWNATVTPNDGYIDGAMAWSNSVTVVAANSAPTVGNLTMNSTSTNNYSNGTLQSYWDMGDLDGDSQVLNETRWFKDGALQSGLLNSTTVAGGNISKGEVWNLSVRVYDGTVWSAWSSNVSITIANPPPYVTDLVMNSTSFNNYSNGTLQSSWTFSDLDSDSQVLNETRWFKDGALQSGLLNSTDVDSANISKNEVWNISVRLFDGTTWSAWSANVSVSVVNAVPYQGTPVLNSTLGTNLTSENLTVYNVSTVDLDSDNIKNVYNWYLNGNSTTVLNMPMEGGSNGTHAKDYSGYSNNGTVNGATWNSTGGYDGFASFNFDGNDYISVDNPDLPTGDFAVVAWIRYQDDSDNTLLMNNYQTNEIMIKIDGRLRVWTNGGERNSTLAAGDNSLAQGTWYHIAVTRDGSTVNGYVNGILNTSGTDSTAFDFGSCELLIGTDSDGAGVCAGSLGNYFNGAIDDLMILNQSLSVEQIRALYMNQTDKIVSQETSEGDVWNATVTPNDGLIDGATVWSNSVTVGNSAPTVSNIVMNSTSVNNYSNGTLQSSWTFSDNDSDSQDQNETRWFKDGALQSALLNSTTVDSANISKDEVWNLSVRVHDGTEWSAWSANVSVSVANAAPTQGTPILNSTLGTNLTSENLTVYNVSTADADSDVVKNVYNWYKDGTSTTVLNMPFEGDPNSSNTRDYSSYKNNGTKYNAVWNRTGGYDGAGAYEFDGVGDYFDLSTPIEIADNKPWSISLWTKSKEFTSNDGLLGNKYAVDDYERLYIAASNNLIWVNRDNVGPSWTDAIPTANIWYHIVVVNNGSDTSNIDAYVNGVSQGVKNQAETRLHIEEVGSMGGSGTNCFNGTIDDLMIFNYSLSVEQIMVLYSNRTDLIVSQETNVGDVWNVTITPNDGTVDGATTWSNSLTVLNSVPTVGNLTINSTSANNYSNGTLQSYWDMGDLDGDSQVLNETRWFKDGALQSGLLNSTDVALGNLTGGEVWNLSVRVHDGSSWSGWSSNVSVTLGNPPAYATDLVMNSTSANNYSNGTLQSSWTFSDLDSDSQVLNETRWFKDGALQSGLLNSTDVDSANISKDEIWNISVRLFDGTSWGIWSSNVSVSVANAAPYQGVVSLNFSGTNITTDNLTLYNYTFDTDGDAVKNVINWFKDNFPITILNMPFDINGSSDNSSNIKDYSYYRNNGTLGNATFETHPYWNQSGSYDGSGAYMFDGNDYIRIVNDGRFDFEDDNFSISLWVKNSAPASDTDVRKIISNGRTSNNLGYYIGYQASTDKLQFGDVASAVYQNYVGMDDGDWHHVVAVYTSGYNYSIYLDGVELLLTTAGILDGFNASGEDVCIGCYIYGYARFEFNGSIDDVIIFNHSLSVEQVNAIYSNETVIVSQEISKGEVWNASVTPNDGFVDGATVWSNSLTVLNSLPTLAVTMNSSSDANLTTGTLQSYWAFSDIDADSQVLNETRWSKNGALQSGLLNSTTVASGNLTGGDIWRLSVRVYDGEDWSTWSNNLSVTIVAVPAEEEESSSSSGGGGGGGGGRSNSDDEEEEEIIRAPEMPVQSFSVDKDSFNLNGVEGFISSDSFEITNRLSVPVEIRIEILGLDIIHLEDNVITLQPGELRSITFNLVPTESGIFTGTIKLYYGNEVYNLPAAINVQSEKSLFDINVNLYQKKINPGDTIIGQIFLLQAGFQQKEDVTLNYVVKDFYGNTMLVETDTIAVFEQALFNKELDTSSLPTGDYVYGAEVVYSGGVATASEQFAVVDEDLSESEWILTLTLVFVFIVFIIIIAKYKKLLFFR